MCSCPALTQDNLGRVRVDSLVTAFPRPSRNRIMSRPAAAWNFFCSGLSKVSPKPGAAPCSSGRLGPFSAKQKQNTRNLPKLLPFFRCDDGILPCVFRQHTAKTTQHTLSISLASSHSVATLWCSLHPGSTGNHTVGLAGCRYAPPTHALPHGSVCSGTPPAAAETIGPQTHAPKHT